MEPFNFKQFWLGMSKDERDAFAEEPAPPRFTS